MIEIWFFGGKVLRWKSMSYNLSNYSRPCWNMPINYAKAENVDKFKL